MMLDEKSDRHQVINAVLGQLQDVRLARVVLRRGTLVGRTVVVLHRELAAAVTDTEHGTGTLLESLRSLFGTLGLPDIELADP